MSTITTAPTTARRIFNPLQRDYATLLESAQESGGTRTLLEVELAPGGGNAPHTHRTYDEHFEVVSGTLSVRVGDEWHRLGPGDAAIARMREIHCFRNETGEDVVFRVDLRPGHAGFERALQAGYGLAADGRTRADGMPRSLYDAAVLIEWSEIGLVGLERALMPLLRRLARRAKRLGIDRRLEERYCNW